MRRALESMLWQGLFAGIMLGGLCGALAILLGAAAHANVAAGAGWCAGLGAVALTRLGRLERRRRRRGRR